MTIQENWENWLSQSGSFLDVQNYKPSDFKNIDLMKTWPTRGRMIENRLTVLRSIHTIFYSPTLL